MTEIKLEATKRTDKDTNLNELRSGGEIPVVLYGQGKESNSLKVNYKMFHKAYVAAGESTIIKLLIDGKETGVLLKEVQKHPVTDKYIHADFYEVDMNKEITANIPLVFEGTSRAVKDDGGTLVASIDEIEVECLPANLPKEIKVDISPLKTFEDVIKIKDLIIPENVKVADEAEEVVATVMPPRSEEDLKGLDAEVTEDVTAVEGVEKPEEDLEATDSEVAGAPEKKDEAPADDKSKKE